MKLGLLFNNGHMAVSDWNSEIDDAHEYLDSVQENIKNGQYVIINGGKSVYESKNVKAVVVYM
ncbi:MAG: hypothetical protein ACQEXV_05560 [Bacillota bacterium]